LKVRMVKWWGNKKKSHYKDVIEVTESWRVEGQ
jgi:hypothetical protein